MTREEIDELFKLREEAYRARDVDALVAMYTEDCVVESPIFGVITGRAAIETSFRHILARIPDLRLETEKLIVMGDEVAQVFTGTGTDMGGFFGTQEFGRPFRTPGVLLYVMKNGQIARERRLYDVNGILLRKVEQELKMAAEIQQALLPHGRYSQPGFEVAATSVPCRKIGGDFCDFFDLPSGAFSLVLGDVAGKGPPAALLATMLQGLFARERASANTLDYVNRATLRRAIEARFATLVYAELSSRRLLDLLQCWPQSAGAGWCARPPSADGRWPDHWRL
jgi:ketosteroid isomerase-like protein